MTKTGIAAIALCALLAGCETFTDTRIEPDRPWRPVAQRECRFNNCTVEVRVVNGQVEVDAQEVRMARVSRDVIMRWVIVTPGYEFRATGDFLAPIIFKGENAADAPGQFSQRRVGARGQVVSIQNQNRNSARYTYKVRVYKQGGGPNDFLESDPVIFNDF